MSICSNNEQLHSVFCNTFWHNNGGRKLDVWKSSNNNQQQPKTNKQKIKRNKKQRVALFA